MFKSRVALAATLSSNYGIYNGFELLEHEPIPGREEYLNSEKYEIKVRDWNMPGNIKDYLGRLNALRRDNAALLQTANLRFLLVDNDNVIGFLKESVDGDNAVAVRHRAGRAGPQEFWLHFGDEQHRARRTTRAPVRAIENLVTGERHLLEWGGVRLRIDPADDPALLFRCDQRESGAMNVVPRHRRRSRRPPTTGCGTRTPSSISCTSRHSPTATATASAISPG